MEKRNKGRAAGATKKECLRKVAASYVWRSKNTFEGEKGKETLLSLSDSALKRKRWFEEVDTEIFSGKR